MEQHSPDTNPVSFLTLYFLASRNMRNRFVLFTHYPVSNILIYGSTKVLTELDYEKEKEEIVKQR